MFKEIFTCPECRNYTCSLISKITNIDFDYLKRNLKVENTTLPIDRSNEKNNDTDVLLSVEGNIINLEMNNDYYDGLFERNNLYAYKVMGRSIRRGDKYLDYKRLVQINLDSFIKFKKVILTFKMMEIDTHEIESEGYIKYHISLPIITKKYYNKEKLSDLEKMLFLIATNEVKDLENVSRGDEILMEYEKKIKDLSEDELYVNLFDADEDARMVQNSKEAYYKKIAREEGIKEGRKEGRKESINEIVLNMIKDGLDSDLIRKYTGISKEELDYLINM